MGKVFKPGVKGRKQIIEEATRDMSPGVRDAVIHVFESWTDKESEERLMKLLGERETKTLLKKTKKLTTET